MAVRFFLMPLVVIGTRRGPKYLRMPDSATGVVAPYGLIDYSALTDTCIVAADVTNAEFTTITANADVTGVPLNIDNTIGAGNIAAVRQALEDLRIPGNWAATGNTYREVLRFVCGLFQFARRHYGMHGQRIIPDNIELDQTWSELPNGWQDNLRATADSFGFDYSQVTGSTTIRAILKGLADQWKSTVFNLYVASL